MKRLIVAGPNTTRLPARKKKAKVYYPYFLPLNFDK